MEGANVFLGCAEIDQCEDIRLGDGISRLVAEFPPTPRTPICMWAWRSYSP